MYIFCARKYLKFGNFANRPVCSKYLAFGSINIEQFIFISSSKMITKTCCAN